MAIILPAPYATRVEYTEWKVGAADGITEDPAITADLRRSREAVDRQVTLAYEVTDDADLFPTDADLLNHLKVANCIQYEYFLETGDMAGAGDYAGVKTQLPGPEMIQYLRTHGLINPAVGRS